MAVMKTQVFLISGQYVRDVDGFQQLAPEIEQCVVIASDGPTAYKVIATNEPAFKPVGHATLQDYETAATKLRAVLKGETSGWKLLVAPGMKI